MSDARLTPAGCDEACTVTVYEGRPFASSTSSAFSVQLT
jgi:hypothetical protein